MARDPATSVFPARGERLALVVVVVLAAALRLFEAARTPLWFDEIYLILAGRRPLPELLALAANDIHPPLVFVAAGAWRALVGDHPVALKLLPILVSLGTVLLTARLAARMATPRAGLLAGLLVALHVTHVQVSQDFEVYAWLAFWIAALANLGWDALAPHG